MEQINSSAPKPFKLLTSESLKRLLSEPKDRYVSEPEEDFLDGNKLPRKYFGQFDPNTMACLPLEEIDPAFQKVLKIIYYRIEINITNFFIYYLDFCCNWKTWNNTSLFCA